MDGLMSVLSAFGLSGAAGLNAYIPLLGVALMGRLGVVHLTGPYEVLTSWWVIGLLGVLLAVEVVVDKVPGADHVNDVVQTVVRPVAGAVLFAAAAGWVREIHPYVALGLGLALAFGVHGVKVTTRPVVNVATGGLGAPVVSAIEDGVAVVTTVLAILVPVVMLVFMAGVGYLGWRWWRGRRGKVVGA